MIIKKFESFNQKLYTEIDYSGTDNFNLLNTNEHGEVITPAESERIKHYLQKLSDKPIIKDGYSSIVVKYPLVSFTISKKQDEWWYVKIAWDLSGRIKSYKCDTIEGLFELVDDMVEARKNVQRMEDTNRHRLR